MDIEGLVDAQNHYVTDFLALEDAIQWKILHSLKDSLNQLKLNRKMIGDNVLGITTVGIQQAGVE